MENKNSLVNKTGEVSIDAKVIGQFGQEKHLIGGAGHSPPNDEEKIMKI